MTEKAIKNKEKKPFGNTISIQRSTLFTIIVDVVLLVAMVTTLLIFLSNNRVDTYNQNIDNITNIAVSKSELVASALENSTVELKGIYSYCTNDGIKTKEEVLNYLSVFLSDSDEYQLLKFNEDDSTDAYPVFDGYSTKKTSGLFNSVTYSNSNLCSSLLSYGSTKKGEIVYSQTFTNASDALKYYAAYCGITVSDNGVDTDYYLISLQGGTTILSQLGAYSQYDHLDTAICDTDGKYLATGDSFKADNFYEYLYKYNDLSLDKKNEIRASVQQDEDGTGVLTYLNNRNNSSVFVYSKCNNAEDWYVIVSVPESDFVSTALLSAFPLIIIGFLVAFLCFNLFRLFQVVKQLQFNIARANEAVEDAERANRAKSRFLSTMSHEIRTPLNAIVGLTSLTIENITDTETAKGYLQKTEYSSKLLLALINDILDISAIESQKLKVNFVQFDLKQLLSSLVSVYFEQCRAKGIDFDTTISNAYTEVLIGDSLRLNQILMNLLANAVKFTPEGGKIDFKIKQIGSEDNKVVIRFVISDTGCGISDDMKARLFKPFEQESSSTFRKFGGTGLGLSIAKSITELMGGTIDVVSVVNKGTTFTVEIPFDVPEGARIEAHSDVNHFKVLVIDDDKDTLTYVSSILRNMNIKHDLAASGMEGLSYIQSAFEKGENYDICIVDWRMPEMDGLEVTRRIRAKYDEKTMIILVTAFDTSDIVDEYKKAGANVVTSKPLFPSTLYNLFVDVSKGHVAIQPDYSDASYDFKGKKILLVEDNPLNSEIATQQLLKVGFVVDCAVNGKKGYDKFCTSAEGEYDLILMDIQMPEMNGYEAARAIRASSHPQASIIPIFAMTADAFTEDIIMSREAGMNAHISKPVDVKQLYSMLHKYLS